MIRQNLLQRESTFVIYFTVIKSQLLYRIVFTETDRQIFESCRSEFIVTEVKLGDRDHVLGVESISKVGAADWRDLVDL
jgi:hypothetical protein